MHTTKCPICGRQNRIVNQCRCDPNNLPTQPLADQSQFAESDKRLLDALEAGEPARQAEYEQRRYDQRIERFALAVFRDLIRNGVDPMRRIGADYKTLAGEAVRAAKELDDAIYPQSAEMPDYIP